MHPENIPVKNFGGFSRQTAPERNSTHFLFLCRNMHVLPPLCSAGPHIRVIIRPAPRRPLPSRLAQAQPCPAPVADFSPQYLFLFLGTYPFFPFQCRFFTPSPGPAAPRCHQRSSRSPRQPGRRRRRRGGGSGSGGGHPDLPCCGATVEVPPSPLNPLHLGRVEGRGGGDQDGGEREGGSRREGGRGAMMGSWVKEGWVGRGGGG